MKYQEAQKLVFDNFANRLLFASADAEAKGYENIAAEYSKLAAHLAEHGDFHAFRNIWAEDAFAFAFNETRGVPREWYEYMFYDMFHRKVGE